MKKMETLSFVIIIAIAAMLGLLALLGYKSKIIIMREMKDLVYEKEVIWKQLESTMAFNEKLNSENAKLHSYCDSVKSECNLLVDDIKDSYNRIKKEKANVVRRLNNISADNGVRNVIGSLYKIGDILYHPDKNTNKIVGKKVIYIEFVDYGSEFDVMYGFEKGGNSYIIPEGLCFKDKETAKFLL